MAFPSIGDGGGGGYSVQFEDSVLTGHGQSNPDLIGHLESLLGRLIKSRFIESVRQTIDHCPKELTNMHGFMYTCM